MKLIQIYEGTVFECQMVKNMLENEEIKAVLKDEVIGSRGHAWMPTDSVKVLVMEEDLEAAVIIANQFRASRQAES
ncbi:putative signal transducing protein [Roseivirga sp.]|uniref:putative signal transducing protein n=1 Tax=Roseivirga sp. TaxID=1964215 RepID=UPI003B52B4E7